MNISDQLKDKGVEVASHIFEELKKGNKHGIELAEAYVKELIEEVKNRGDKDQSYLTLLPVKNMDNYTAVHSINVTIISIIFGFKLNMDNDQMFELGMGALLHDMGKINTPDHLLWQQEGADDYEKTTIAEHPKFGAHWLSTNSMLTDSIIEIIKHHHEDYNGNGYPAGIKNSLLSETVKIVALVNWYEFLTSDFSSKPAISAREACFKISKESSKKFSQKISSSFLSIMGPMLLDGPIFPKKTLILLNTKEIAAVLNTRNFSDIMPEILVITNPQGKKLERPLKVDLKNDDHRFILKILQS
ncbi:MAG: HD domain-containing protein [Spirochaetes bacterium]|nr:HD domain-containing protein [Spirochaetota bacterium]